MQDFFYSIKLNIKKNFISDLNDEEQKQQENEFLRKSRLKDEITAKNMIIIQDQLKKEKNLSNYQKFQCIDFLKQFMSRQELEQREQAFRAFTNKNFQTTFLSLLNVVVICALWKKFHKQHSLVKISIAGGTFFISHYSGMYSTQQQIEQVNDNLMEKYKHNIMQTDFHRKLNDVQQLLKD